MQTSSTNIGLCVQFLCLRHAKQAPGHDAVPFASTCSAKSISPPSGETPTARTCLNLTSANRLPLFRSPYSNTGRPTSLLSAVAMAMPAFRALSWLPSPPSGCTDTWSTTPIRGWVASCSRRSIARTARRLTSTEALARASGHVPPIVKPVRWYWGSLNCLIRPAVPGAVVPATSARASNSVLFLPSDTYTTAQHLAGASVPYSRQAMLVLPIRWRKKGCRAHKRSGNSGIGVKPAPQQGDGKLSPDVHTPTHQLWVQGGVVGNSTDDPHVPKQRLIDSRPHSTGASSTARSANMCTRARPRRSHSPAAALIPFSKNASNENQTDITGPPRFEI